MASMITYARRCARLEDFSWKLTKSTPLKKMEDFTIPVNYMHVISAVKVVAGYNSKKNTYSIPSLVLKLGHSLQKICGIVKSNAMMCGRIVQFISAGAMLFAEDGKVLNAYLEKKQEEYERHLRIIPTADNYAYLATVTLVLAIIFNMRRAGEVTGIDLTAFMS